MQSILCPSPEISGNQALNVFVLLFFYDYYHLFDLVFSLIYILVRYERRPVEANVWTGHKQTEVGPMKLWHQIAWWHHLLYLEWFHLQTTDFLFSTINNVIPQSQALDRAFAQPSATKLEAIPSYSICSIQEVVMALWSIYITSAGDKAGWALRLISKAGLSCRKSNNFLITQLPWLCQSEESLKKNWPLSYKYFKT